MHKSTIVLQTTHKVAASSLHVNIEIIQNSLTCLSKSIDLAQINDKVLLDFEFNDDTSPIFLIFRTDNSLIKDFYLSIETIFLDDFYIIPHLTHSGKVYDIYSTETGDIGNTLYTPGYLQYEIQIPFVANIKH